jgi:DNA-binding CsgD family transcriptional regulator
MADGSIRRLTVRQLEVVALLAEGLRYGEVATQLSMSARQVQRHAVQAVERAGAVNVCHLVALAVEASVI